MPQSCAPPTAPRPHQVPEELWGGRLALALLAQRAEGTGGAFAPYVSALPRGFEGVPMFFPREAIDAIDYPPVTEQVTAVTRVTLVTRLT